MWLTCAQLITFAWFKPWYFFGICSPDRQFILSSSILILDLTMDHYTLPPEALWRPGEIPAKFDYEMR
jgi:hypothetical protein